MDKETLKYLIETICEVEKIVLIRAFNEGDASVQEFRDKLEPIVSKLDEINGELQKVIF